QLTPPAHSLSLHDALPILDISNANTLILERSDMLGLSQLHQLRGRVGRGRERAYAYFLYPPEKPLTETAHDRLATMAAHTDLGRSEEHTSELQSRENLVCR